MIPPRVRSGINLSLSPQLSVSVSQVYNDVDYDAGRFLGGGGQVDNFSIFPDGCVAQQGSQHFPFLSGIRVLGIQGEHALLRTRGAGFRRDGKVEFGIMNFLPLLR